MVHFHLNANGTDEVTENGREKVVSPFIVRAVWIGFGMFLWTAAIFLIAEAIRTIMHL
jgi:hypothetical protein